MSDSKKKAQHTSEADLVKRYAGLVEFLARKFRVESKLIDYDDLVSEALLCVVECGRQFDPRKGASLTRFVRSKARQRMLAITRTANRREDHEAEETDAEQSHPTAQSHEQRVVEETHVTALLKKELTPLESTVVIDKFWGGLTMRCIDDKRGFIPGTARKLYTTALEKLKEVGIDAFIY